MGGLISPHFLLILLFMKFKLYNFEWKLLVSKPSLRGIYDYIRGEGLNPNISLYYLKEDGDEENTIIDARDLCQAFETGQNPIDLTFF